MRAAKCPRRWCGVLQNLHGINIPGKFPESKMNQKWSDGLRRFSGSTIPTSVPSGDINLLLVGNRLQQHCSETLAVLAKARVHCQPSSSGRGIPMFGLISQQDTGKFMRQQCHLRDC